MSTLRTRAFTLIELLVVISIVSLLISILLPALAAARESGNRVKCQSNLRTITQAMQMYSADNQDYIRVAIDLTTATSHRWVNDALWRSGYLSESASNKTTTDMFQCPSGVGDENGRFSVGYNSHYLYGTDERYYKRSGDIKLPTQASMFMDATKPLQAPNTSSREVFRMWPTSALSQYYGHPFFRHSGETSLNVAYFDGHGDVLNQDTFNATYALGAGAEATAFWEGK